MMRLNSSNGCAPLSMRPLMKNAGVPMTPASLPVLHVGLDPVLVLVRIDAGVEPARHPARAPPRTASDPRRTSLRLIGEQPIVVRPELALLGGALRRLGRRPRVGMAWAAGSAIDEPDASPYVLSTWLTRRIRPQAVRTLEIGELDELDRGARRALARAVRPTATFWRGGSSDHAHRRLGLQLLHVRLIDRLRPLLGQQRADRLAHLIERRALHTRGFALYHARTSASVTVAIFDADLLASISAARRDAARLRLRQRSASRRRSRRSPRGAPRTAPSTSFMWPKLPAGCCIAFSSTSASVIGHVADRGDDIGADLHPVGLLRGTRTGNQEQRHCQRQAPHDHAGHLEVYRGSGPGLVARWLVAVARGSWLVEPSGSLPVVIDGGRSGAGRHGPPKPDLIHLDRRHVSKPPSDLKAGFDFSVRTNGDAHVVGEDRG